MDVPTTTDNLRSLVIRMMGELGKGGVKNEKEGDRWIFI